MWRTANRPAKLRSRARVRHEEVRAEWLESEGPGSNSELNTSGGQVPSQLAGTERWLQRWSMKIKGRIKKNRKFFRDEGFPFLNASYLQMCVSSSMVNTVYTRHDEFS